MVADAAAAQASIAASSIALYAGLLRQILGELDFRSTAQQMDALWQQLGGEQPLALDRTGRIRPDGWEHVPGTDYTTPGETTTACPDSQG